MINMRIRLALVAALAIASLGTASAMAQQANPTPGCAASPAQISANKRVAMEFFSAPTADARVALADPNYKQHNPIFVKRAAADQVSDYEEFRRTFLNRGSASQSQPGEPQGNVFEIVTAECDIVTIVHKRYLQDPTAAPGTFYPAYSFDAFRVANGKLTEHWDGNLIPAPSGTQR